MNVGKFKVIFLIIVMVSGIVMTSGCLNWLGLDTHVDEEEPPLSDNPVNTTNVSENQTQQNIQGTDQNQGNSQQGTTPTSTQTTKQNTQTTSQTQTKTTTAHTHTWVTQYVGYDPVKEKIRYKVYCSKCGEVSGYVWY